LPAPLGHRVLQAGVAGYAGSVGGRLAIAYSAALRPSMVDSI